MIRTSLEMNQEIKKIIVVFKTHLDIGFTDFSETVIRKYVDEFIPGALKLARQMRGEKDRFIWSIGSWMIEKYLVDGTTPELLEDAVRHGEIRWHGLPFTAHTELMDQELFTYGLNISRKLDERFGMKTIAAKMTDVPGHTKAIIGPLYKSGIRFLHIGVNPASSAPDVPELFRWRNDEEEEIVVMYHRDYGEMSQIGASDTAVYFAHTGDNRGPQSVEEIRNLYQRIREKYPKADVVPGTLEDIAEIALQQELPVIMKEIGDTWIHGAGTDPGKISQYRALLRLKNQISDDEMQKIYKNILLIPEHTWGLDEKAHLGFKMDNGELIGEHRYFLKSEFQQVKETEKFRKMERSWEEQRRYLTNAVKLLSPATKEIAQEVMREYKRPETDTFGWKRIWPNESLLIGNCFISVTDKGELKIKKAFCVTNAEAEEARMSVGFEYEVFSENEYERFRSQYVVSDEIWALEDFSKIGLEAAVNQYHRYMPCNPQIWVKKNLLVIKMELPEEAINDYGGMRLLEMKAEFTVEKISFDFAWFGKQESRIPEASWIRVAAKDRITSIRKMGTEIRPEEVVAKGNRRMHAVDSVQMEHAEFITVDAPLISIGETGLLNFTDTIPDMTNGFYLNLHNNIWGTNFPMWYGEDARFRFEVVM